MGLELFVRMSEISKTAIPSTLLREDSLLPSGSNLITPPRISGGSAMPIPFDNWPWLKRYSRNSSNWGINTNTKSLHPRPHF